MKKIGQALREDFGTFFRNTNRNETERARVLKKKPSTAGGAKVKNRFDRENMTSKSVSTRM